MIMNKKVLFVANNANGGPVIDGQRAKTRVWLDIFKMENIPFEFVELDGWKKHPFKLISQIKKGIKNNDVILLMAASNGSRTLIPLINKWNKKYDKRFVYSFIGSGPLSNIINKMNADEANDFVLRHNFHNVSDFKFGKEIQKVDCLLTETKIMKDLVNAFYRTKNAIVINNFRNQSRNNLDNAKNSSNVLKCVYISRICKNKGIFDLLGAIENAKNIALDIYGPLQLDNDELKIFNTYLKKNVNTCYCGKIEMPSIVPTIKRYDLVVFPTKFSTESVPGIITESLIAGVPVLSSDFPQRKDLLIDGVDSIIYKFNNKNDLVQKINYLAKNKAILNKLSSGAFESGSKYTYEFWREDFLKSIFGE